jgi:hypothetical protein
MTRTDDSLVLAQRIAEAVIAVIHETPDGAPGGHLYAALMSYMTLEQFEAMMAALIFSERVTKRGDCYYPVG